MPGHTPKLTAQEVLSHTQHLLEEKLPLHVDGYKCATDDLFKVLLGLPPPKAPWRRSVPT